MGLKEIGAPAQSSYLIQKHKKGWMKNPPKSRKTLRFSFTDFA